MDQSYIEQPEKQKYAPFFLKSEVSLILQLSDQKTAV